MRAFFLQINDQKQCSWQYPVDKKQAEPAINTLKQQYLYASLLKNITMEELIKTVTAKAGISESQAKTAVDTVVSFLKDKLPGGLGGQVESFLAGNAGTVGTVIDTVKDKASGLLG